MFVCGDSVRCVMLIGELVFICYMCLMVIGVLFGYMGVVGLMGGEMF